MKNIKDITISIFAVIGFVAIITAFTSLDNDTTIIEEKQILATPESHVWAFGHDTRDSYLFNQVTGEVRMLTSESTTKKGYYDTLKESDVHK